TKEFESNLNLSLKKRKEKEKEKEEISIKIEEKNEIKQELGKSRMLALSKMENASNNEKRLKEVKKEIENFNLINVNEKKIGDIEKNIFENKQEREKIGELSIKINSEIEILKTKIEEHSKLHNTMSDLKVCPTCQQDVDAVYRANILNKTYNEISHSKNRIEELTIQRNENIKKFKEIDVKIFSSEKELTDLKILKMKYEGIIEKEKLLQELERENLSLKKDLILLNKHINNLNDSLFKISKFDILFNEKEKELKEAMRQEKIAEIKLMEVRKVIEVYSKTILEFKEKVKKIEEIKKNLDYITQLENWLSKKFVPVVTFLEKNVMASLKKEFSKLFSEWFQTLVSDNFVVRLTDDFTPIIEQQDYELDYSYLSGGERTAIALAYRLALNQVINSLRSKIKTRELVILDEPTDGFSDQQLDKMRGVLEQLKVKQLIIVSHEQKIESFV
ncbi:hypothetical protein COT60_01660, partial [Candidatus Pacearchaeota archaeon CG09_land_8_20_14_0_10_30_9]